MSDLDRFLDKIGEIESHNGKYTNHHKMTSGIHQGYSAIGKYGLMPLTVQEISHNSQDPELRSLASKDPQEYSSIINSSPELEKKIASELASKVLSRQGGDELKAAYAWNQGHNLSPEQISDDKLLGSPYVHKYFQLAGSAPQKNSPQVPDTSMNPIPMNSSSEPKGEEETPTLNSLLDAYKSLKPVKEFDLRKSLDEEPESEPSEDENDSNSEDLQGAQIAALEKMR